MNNEAGLVVTGRRVLVRMDKIDRYTRGGIALPDTTTDAEERAQTRGIVIAMGAEAGKCPEMAGIEIGDTVLFARYAGDNIKHVRAGVTYRVLNAPDVVGYLEADPDASFQAARPSSQLYGT